MKSVLSVLAVGLALLSISSVSDAQSCTDDSDCASEDYCDLPPRASGSAPDCAAGQVCDSADGAPSGVLSADEGAPVPVPEQPVGTCERGGRQCTSDSECLADHYCALDDVSMGTCPSDQDCSDVELPVPTGRCEREPYACSTDADCPEPAVCNDGGECVYRIEPCQSDQECSDAYECLRVGGSSRDESAAEPALGAIEPVPADVEPGAAAGDGESSASEELAGSPETEAEAEAADAAEGADTSDDERDDIGMCFPRLVPCATDADCDDDWTCARIDEAPPSWGDVAWACLPPAIDAALRGDLPVDGGEWSESDSGSSPETGDDEDGSAVDLDDRTQSTERALGTQGGSEGTAPKGGCSVGLAGSQRDTAPWWTLVALGAALSLKRRRAELRRYLFTAPKPAAHP